MLYPYNYSESKYRRFEKFQHNSWKIISLGIMHSSIRNIVLGIFRDNFRIMQEEAFTQFSGFVLKYLSNIWKIVNLF